MVRYLRTASSRWAGAFFVFLALVSGVFYYGNVHQQRSQIDCQAKYNQAFAGQLIARSRIADAASAALNDSDQAKNVLLKGVGSLFLLEPTEDKKEEERREKAFLQYFRDFDAASAKFDASAAATVKARAENPLPLIPEC